MGSRKTLEAVAEAMAERRERERRQREERGREAAKPKEERAVTAKEIVTAEARAKSTYIDDFMPDLEVQNQGRHRMVKVIRNLYPSVVDRWLAEGGSGFDEPQRRAIDHCRALWNMIGERRLVANYTGVGGGDGETESASLARLQLAEYQDDIPRAYWLVFENCVRFDMPAGRAGTHLAKTPTQQQAQAKAAVGFVASLIAMWRGY